MGVHFEYTLHASYKKQRKLQINNQNMADALFNMWVSETFFEMEG